MKILAVDPGYDRCGVAVLDGIGTKATLLYSNCITTSKNVPFIERLRTVEMEVHRIFKEFKPKILAMEKLHLKANRQSAMQVAETRGAILARAAESGVSVHEYAPASVKVAVTGYGMASKQQVLTMVRKLIKCPDRKMLDDEYDAIAVGITALASIK